MSCLIKVCNSYYFTDIARKCDEIEQKLNVGWPYPGHVTYLITFDQTHLCKTYMHVVLEIRVLLFSVYSSNYRPNI